MIDVREYTGTWLSKQTSKCCWINANSSLEEDADPSFGPYAQSRAQSWLNIFAAEGKNSILIGLCVKSRTLDFKTVTAITATLTRNVLQHQKTQYIRLNCLLFKDPFICTINFLNLVFWPVVVGEDCFRQDHWSYLLRGLLFCIVSF